jgi:ribose-phosphate pyrophosphokinase
MMVLGFSDYDFQAHMLASELGVDYGQIDVHRFPDEESLVRIPTGLSSHIIICLSLDKPNNKLIEIIFAAETARKYGASRITLVAPYLCYMRQDIENQPGEAVSQRIIGQMLAEYFDDVITVDPHLHRIDHLQEAIPLPNAIALMATPAVEQFLRCRPHKGMIFGPDEESGQWVTELAERLGFSSAVAKKVRHGDADVSIELPNADYTEKEIYIIDDMISTGNTIAQATQLLHAEGARCIRVITTHALFNSEAEKRLHLAGVESIWSCDSVQHHSNCIPLAPLLAQAIQKL